MIHTLLKVIKNNWGIAVILVLSICLTFYRLADQSFGFDEAYSIYITKNWSAMLSTIWNHEANMWLYYVFLHFWQIFGTGAFAVRSLSALFAAATIPVIYMLGTYIANKRVGLLASLLTTLNVAFVLYAQETRSYTLVMFLVTVSSYAFLRYNENKIYKIIFVLSGALAIYAHFYAGFVLLAQIITALFRKNFKQFIPSLMAIFLFVTPLIIAPSIHSHQVDWIVAPTLKSLVGVMLYLWGDFPPLFAIFSLIFLFTIPFFIKNRSNYEYRFLFVWLIFPIIFSFLVSIFIKPLYQSTYFLICLPPLMLIAAISINRIKKNWVKVGLILMIIAFSIIRLFLLYTENTQYKWLIDNKKYDWKSAIFYMYAHEKSTDTLMVYPYQDKVPYLAYNAGKKLKIIEISSKPYLLSGGKTLPEPDITGISLVKNPHIWLFLHVVPDENFIHNKKQADEIVSTLLMNYRIDYTKKYFGIELIHLTNK